MSRPNPPAAKRAHDEVRRLRAALDRVRQGYANILEFRKIADSDRYGALTRDEIEAVMEEIESALDPADKEQL